MTLEELFKYTDAKGASDLHIIPGYRPTIRVHNELLPIMSEPILTAEATKQILITILSNSQKEEFEINKEIDFGFNWQTIRFRVNYYFMRGGYAGAFRLVPFKIKTLEELNLPSAIHQLSKLNDGLVLLTGPTGEGKSTTIAAVIDEINSLSRQHIVTIEDPIEFVFTPKQSMISQRELHADTHSWAKALKSVLREDPDVVLIGEMRDLETIQAALTVAETGHLVFSTMHTRNTSEAINRIIDAFSASQQNQIRSQLSTVLRAVIYQRLIPTVDKNGRVPAVEILFNTFAVAALIREGKAFMIDNILETNEEKDMILFEKYLARLYRQNLITREAAYKYSSRVRELEKFIK